MWYWRIGLRKNKKNGAAIAVKYWIQFSIYSKHLSHFNATLLAATAYISKAELLEDCWWRWRFSELNWNRSIRSKASWAKSFLMLPSYRKHTTKNQRKTVRGAVTINVCERMSSCELFSFGHHSRHVANSNSGKVMITCYRIRNFFQKERRYSYRS